MRVEESEKYGRVYVFNSDSGTLSFPSVTTVLGGSADHSWYNSWVAAVGQDRVNFVSKLATDHGTRLHLLVEHYLNNESLDWDKTSFARMIFNVSKSVLDPIDNIHGQEMALFSKKLKIAGRCDCIGEYDGVLSLIDFKTSKHLKTRADITDYFLQTTLYAIMYHERTGISVKDLRILVFNDFGKPSVFEGKIKDYYKEAIDRVKKFYSKDVSD